MIVCKFIFGVNNSTITGVICISCIFKPLIAILQDIWEAAKPIETLYAESDSESDTRSIDTDYCASDYIDEVNSIKTRFPHADLNTNGRRAMTNFTKLAEDLEYYTRDYNRKYNNFQRCFRELRNIEEAFANNPDNVGLLHRKNNLTRLRTDLDYDLMIAQGKVDEHITKFKNKKTNILSKLEDRTYLR